MGQKRNMPSKVKILNYWKDRIDEAVDINHCFACSSLDSRLLDRAHILAKHLGGEDSVENLHILCKHCHISSETLSGEQYWHWFNATSGSWFEITLARCVPVIMALSGISSPDEVRKHLINQDATKFASLFARLGKE